MRRTLFAVALGAAVLVSVPLAASAASAAPVHHRTRTNTTVLRPVTESGRPAPGYRIAPDPKGSFPVNCQGPGAASPVAVDKNILECFPTAAYAVACWHAAQAHHVLCLDDAHSHALRRLTVSGSIPHTQPVAHLVALNLKLANGVYCGLRFGGAAAGLRQHHTWYASYYCSNHQAVWSPESSTHAGVDHAHPVWTVEVANSNGRQRVHTTRVQDAYFVGTRH